MKDLYDITEGILDDMDDIMDKADTAAHVSVCAEWLSKHGVTYRLSHVVRNPSDYPNLYNADTETWHLEDATITVGKKDPVPEFLKVDKIRDVNIHGWDQPELPSIASAAVRTLSIRNCPKLKSLQGCSQKVERFAVSNCPNVKSLDGCPKEATNMFKVVDLGNEFGPKDIKRYCKVDKKNMIY